MEDSLLLALRRYAASGAIPMHMPGHKRNESLAPYLQMLNAPLDITEIDGFDDLHDAHGILRQGMERAAHLWGARRSFFLVNGSTGGLLAAIHAVLGAGGDAIVARNCHKSIYHGLELCGVTPHFVCPPVEQRIGVCGSIVPEDIERALKDCPCAKLVIVTSPTYEGVISDIRTIAEIAHRYGAVLLVDEAHGAHLGMGDFPEGAVACGADLVVQSAHKTLPSLTQTALLHLQGNLVDPERVERSLGIFQTSSPSYLLMASLDSCVSLWEKEGQTLASQWLDALHKFEVQTQELHHLILLGQEQMEDHTVFALDPSKIVISTTRAGVQGPELMDWLREKQKIELEMACADYVVAMTGPGDTEKTLDSLAQALRVFDKECAPCHATAIRAATEIPIRIYRPDQAVTLAREKCPLETALGRISAGYIWAYPPGIPLLIPGEQIDEAVLQQILVLQRSGVALKGISDGLWVLCE